MKKTKLNLPEVTLLTICKAMFAAPLNVGLLQKTSSSTSVGF